MKSKLKPKPGAPYRAPRWHRNADGLDDLDVPEDLLVPAPIFAGPAPGTPEASSMAMVPYNQAYAAAQMRPPPMARPPMARSSLAKRAATAARAKAVALKPTVVNPLNKDHLLRAAAGAGGGVAASLAAREFGDNFGERNLALVLTGLGALGTVFLDDHWQRVAAGVLAGGMSQYTGAYLTERAEKKLSQADKARIAAERAALAALAAVPVEKPPAAAAPAAPRNAYGYPVNDNDVYGAVDRAHHAVDAMLADERNGYAAPYGDVIDVDPNGGYAA